MAGEPDKLQTIIDGLSALNQRLDKTDQTLVSHGAIITGLKARADAATEEERKQKEREAAEGEKQDKAKKDAARKDAARKDKFGPRKDGESDEDYKKRMDADEKAMCDELEKGGHDKDSAKADAAECRKDAEKEHEKAREDKARRDAIARADATAAENAQLREQLATLNARVNAITNDLPAEERDALAAAQARADSIYAALGQRASQPLPGEKPLAYRKRLLQPLLRHSPQFKDAKIDSADDLLLKPLEEKVYADAVEAAKRADSAAPGVLIPHYTRDAAGRQITTYTGDILSWMEPFMRGGDVFTVREFARTNNR